MNDRGPTNNTEAADYAERRFREFADAMPHILWTAQPDGIVDYLNKTYLDYTGMSPDVVTQNWQKAVHPEDTDRTLAVWGEAIANGKDYVVEFRLYHKSSDQYRWQAVSAKPVRNEAGQIVKWYGSATDIHESKISAETAALLARRLDATMEGMSDGFIMMDPEWRVVYINAAAEKGLQRSRTTLLGKVYWEMFPQFVDSKVYQECFRVASDRRTVEFEYNSPIYFRWLEIRIYPLADGIAMYFRDISQRKQAEHEIQRLAFHDQVTGIPNRQFLYDRIRHANAGAGGSEAYGAFLIIDLDNFKAVNDTQGHAKGDLLLQEVAQRLERCASQGVTVARFGADQFVVMLENLSSERTEAAAQAKLISEKLVAALAQPYRLENIELIVTSSVGVSMFEGSADDINSLYKQADMAMYQAKAEGGNTIRFYDPDMQAALNAKKALLADLREAISKQMFALHYQPQVDQNGHLDGAEALLRWEHPVRGNVPPTVFIPLAEESGMILELGSWVMHAACGQLAAWAGVPTTAHLTLAVNVSARQFRHPSFVDDVQRAVRQAGADASKLKLELTESVLVEDVEEATEKMNALRAFGIGLSLDDFGTGYSSLSYLRHMPLAQLKIDRSFIIDLPGNKNDMSIVEAIIALGRKLGLAVIAEGVESDQQLEFLAKAGCNAYQGYFFSKPLSQQDFNAYLMRKKPDS